MDIDSLTKAILSLSSANQIYIKELQEINSELSIDSVNDNINKSINITELDLKNVIKKGDRARVLSKKITENVCEIKRLLSQAKLPDDYFDDSNMLTQYRAKVMTVNVPEGTPGDTDASISVEYMNIGYAQWDTVSQIRLRIVVTGPENYSQTTYFPLDADEVVDIGDSKIFSFTLHSSSESGLYNIGIGMCKGEDVFDFRISRQIYVL